MNYVGSSQFRDPMHEGAGEIAVYRHDIQKRRGKIATSISRGKGE
jgi:hypothetical protein